MSDPVPTTDDDTTPPEDFDAMQAASITPADVGETPTSADTPAVTGHRSAEDIFTARPNVVAKIEAITGVAFGSEPDDSHEVPESDDPAEYRRQVNETAWMNSIIAADLTDLATWRVTDLQDDHFPVMLREFARSLAGEPKVRNLVLAGNTGPGKTSCAMAVGWEALAAGKSVRIVEHAKYLMWLRPNVTPPAPYQNLTHSQLQDRMRAPDVLILDDLGASLDPEKAVTEHVKDATLTLIGDRIDTPGKVTIVTTNRRSEELEVMFGEQFLSRLSKRGHVLKFVGHDRRGRLSW